jgi:release factor glutamine methyltransferase
MNMQSEAVRQVPHAFEAIDWAATVLRSSGIDDAEIDAEVLLRFALECDRTRLYGRYREKLDTSQWERYQQLIERRAKREPVAYIVGAKEFMSLEFEVNRDVLIPRPETELLAEFAVRFLNENIRANLAATPMVTDIGTGSGCLAVTIAKTLPQAVVYASDVSEAALTVAERNARRHGVAERVHFRRGDVFEAFENDDLHGKVHLIVSNPPYVSRSELGELQPEIRGFEPEIAYLGGDDGLSFHRKLVNGGAPFLTDSGVLAFEIGFGQAEEVRKMVASDGRYDLVDTLIDYAGIERVIVARVKE